MNILIYVRVSTDKQAERQLSLPAQLAACRQYANQRDWHIVDEFVEPGVSARTADRPSLKRLLQRCRTGRPAINAVIVHKLDRLARNVADHTAIRAILSRRQISLVSVTENLDESVSGMLVEHIMAAISEFYSSNLAEEVRKGMRQLVLQGGWPHQPPRGYRSVATETGRKRLEPDPDQAPLVQFAFDRFASGDRTLTQLSIELADLGMVAGSGRPLSATTLRTLLSNRFYIGRIVWSDLDRPGRHPALIAPELFESVQAVLKARRRRVVPLGKIPGFPLRGIAVCGECGAKMIPERHGRHKYYRCSQQQKDRTLCRSQYSIADCIHVDLHRLLEKAHAIFGQEALDVLAWSDAEVIEQLRRRIRTAVLARDRVLCLTLLPA